MDPDIKTLIELARSDERTRIINIVSRFDCHLPDDCDSGEIYAILKQQIRELIAEIRS